MRSSPSGPNIDPHYLSSRALQINVSQSLEVGLDGSVTFELNARDLKCEQQGSGQWICKAGRVCDK